MTKRLTSTLLLFFAVIAIMFSACSRNSGTTTTDPNAPVATATTSPATATSPTPDQSTTMAPVSSQATKNGWWIRINPTATTAQVITFQIGTNKIQREEWRVWNSGQPAEFDVPEKYSQVPSLYVRGNVSPIGKFATLCVMYKNRGVEHMSFDDDDSETMLQTEIDIKCR
ncbi:MAG TPA: hypothetical protein VJ810_06140 [Blastocatellia bacterium]|nr:hypothetical protein [Blastocatellia bacterium]